MMKKYLLLSLTFIVLAACQNSNEKSEEKKYLPPSSGTHAELLLVVENPLWESRTRDAIADVFGEVQDGLPQAEGKFSINKIGTADFKGLLKRTKSMVFIERSDTTLVESRKNVWAKPQTVTTITAPTEQEIINLLKQNKTQLEAAHYANNIETVQTRMRSIAYKNLPESLREFNIKSMLLQKGFTQTLDKKDIKIFRQETKRTTQFLVFSTRPINDNEIVGQDIIAARDSIGKKYFEGSSDHSYFATETQLPPTQQQTEIDDKFAIETRGLWKTVGDFMGGPFLSYTIYNDDKGEILTLEGFIFGPDAKKRNIMLEMESMFKSVQFAE